MRVRVKIWLEKDGKPIISEGKFRLLREIQRTGSILKAAESLGLSYKRAHSQIKAIEERIGVQVLERRRGSGSRLTKEGEKILETYERVCREISKTLENLKDLPLKEE